MGINIKNHFTAQIIAAFVVVILYSATFAVMDHYGFWVVDNGLKFIQAAGIGINEYKDYFIPWSGVKIDPGFKFNPVPPPFGFVIENHLHGTFSISFATISSLAFDISGYWGLYIIPLLGGFLTIFGAWRIGRFINGGETARFLCIIITALCTPMWFYSETFWEHAPGVGLFTMAVFYAMRYLLESRKKDILLCALFCGLSIYFRDELYVFSAVLIGTTAFLRRDKWKEIALFVPAITVTLAPLWLFQWWALGSPFGWHLLSISPFEAGVLEYVKTRWVVFDEMLISAHGIKALSIITVVPFLALFMLYPKFSEKRSNIALSIITLLSIVSGTIIFAGHIFSKTPLWHLEDANGLFAASPILLLAFVRIFQGDADKGRIEPEKFLRLISLLYILIYIVLSPSRKTGGIHWGCRYMLPLYPMFAVMVASTIATWWEKSNETKTKLAAILIAVSILLSFAAQVYSVNILAKNKSYNAKLNRTIAARPEKVILTSGWTVPLIIPNNFYDKDIYLITDRAGMTEILNRLRNEGIDRVLEINWHFNQRPMNPDSIFIESELRFMNFEIRSVSLQ